MEEIKHETIGIGFRHEQLGYFLNFQIKYKMKNDETYNL